MILHILAQFSAYAHARNLPVFHSHGDLGYVLWVQPRHGVSLSLAVIRGHVSEWLGVRN